MAMQRKTLTFPIAWLVSKVDFDGGKKEKEYKCKCINEIREI